MAPPPALLSIVQDRLENHKHLQISIPRNSTAQSRSSRRHQIEPRVNTPSKQPREPTHSISRLSEHHRAHSLATRRNPRPTDTMSNVPEIVVNDVTNKYNVEILRNHKTGLLPWETRIGRLKRRFTRVEDAVKRAVRKGVQDLVVVAAVSYRIKKRQ
jgi:hypothetical protein